MRRLLRLNSSSSSRGHDGLTQLPPLRSYGESHGKSVGVIVDGFPPSMSLTESGIQPDQSSIITPRNRKDRVVIQGGTEFGITFGTPIGLLTNYSGSIQAASPTTRPSTSASPSSQPAVAIGKNQTTATYDGSEEGVLAAKGRHGSCVVPRAISIVEATAAVVLLGATMAQHARQVTKSLLPPIKRENSKA
ncbi:chorismate synthase [Colletotrichum graminicola M1.001]|uniref:chorismate synthase n=1 Tax=Colletotrichum graminicola (strain M1.001 / M2 / FGSC 10212) TaxID=645133 RepID=E3QW71_COLGM|nr:chorismate synthase [Colletotrichum graminicola M1.001]EFQ35105.1 chorismate synthase [Colletotrichum graminicola M1.001]